MKDEYIPSFHNYRLYHVNRTGYIGGGLAILVRNDLVSIEKNLNHYSGGKLEIQGITIISNKIKLDVVNVYNPVENISVDEFLFYMRQLNSHSIFLGDFNAHHSLWTDRSMPNQSGKNLSEAILQYEDLNLLTPFNFPTYYNIANNQFSTLDLLFVSNNLFPMSQIQLGEDMGSDHEPIVANIAFKPELFKVKRRPRWLYENGSWSHWQERLPEIQTMPNASVTESSEIFSKALVETSLESFGQTKEFVNVKYSKPWWNKDCDKATREKHKAKNRFRKHPTPENYEIYKEKEQNSYIVVKKSKELSIIKFSSEINKDTPVKKLCEIISCTTRN